MTIAGHLLASFAVGLAVTWLLKLYAVRAELIDIPNQRSSHTSATPRGGGLSVVIAVVGYFVLSSAFGLHWSLQSVAVLGAAVLVAVIGFVDDHRHVPAKIRFGCHSLAALAVIVATGGLAPVAFGATAVDLGVAGDLVALIFIVWFTNLFNFMDGIDGIAGVEAIAIAGGMSLILGLPNSSLEWLLLVIVGSTAGFLVWNWAPARVFMGDVGSGFIGFILAASAVSLHAEGVANPWPWLILAGVFIVDSTTTLIVRILRGESWHQAHRTHAYQILAKQARSHATVSTVVALVNLVLLLPLAYWAYRQPESGWWLTIVAWAPLAVLALYEGAGQPERD